MTENPAEILADAILRAAGSSLRHYTPPVRAKIIAAAKVGIEDAYLNGVCDERANHPDPE